MDKVSDTEAVTIPANPPSGFKVVLRELRHDKGAIVAVVVVALILLTTIIGGFVIPHSDLVDANILDRLGAPGVNGHILGTDSSGRDILKYLIVGARNSIGIGVSVAVITEVLGIIIGITAGYFGGILDEVVMRVVDFFMVLPTLLMIIILVTIVPNFNALSLILIISSFGWMGTTRLIRSAVLSQSERDYVAAAKTSGTPSWKIMFGEVMPNISSLIITDFVLAVAGNIGVETGLSYLGFGLPPDTPSLGTMIAYANDPDLILNSPWMWLPAALLLLVLTLSINAFGNALRRAADSRQRT
ncbi:ABC transporter permease [Lacticaseibacillus brantae]|uniref:Oligopeptide ABC transporter permease n=1 Tax=Lacticaseibacillus brantae DSM 23927 TaxID=1423727 RepID=A0A0R2B8S0_9LACO|nr:ABC transporter permease [Lacticaseibacillus brantae]KRM72793.1 oligopeptide ABC transporter permease [Lacticaseibacillus brantae DSM 23927]